MDSGHDRTARAPGHPVDPTRGTWVAVGYALAAVAVAGSWGVVIEAGTALTPFLFTILLATAFVAERIAFPLSHRGWYTPSTPVVVLTGLIGGPLAGAFAGAVTAAGDLDGAWRRRLAFGGLDAVRGFVAGLAGLVPIVGPTGAVLQAGLAVGCAFVLNAAGLRLIHQVRIGEPARVFRRGLLADALEAVVAVPVLALLLHSSRTAGGTLVVLTLAGLLVALWLGSEAYRRSRAALAAEQMLARTDPLTGAPNRRALEEELRRAHARALRGERPSGVLVFDVDLFRAINARHGWDGGDTVLRELVHRLSHSLRETDLLARRGGEEFVIVAAGVESGRALRRVAEEIRQRVRGVPFEADGRSIPVTVSVGAALLDGSVDAETAQRRANNALARAKAHRDRVVVWDEGDSGTLTVLAPAS